MSLRIVFMGTPEFAVPSLKALVRAGYEVVGTAIAKMSGADVADVEKMLSGLSAEVDIYSKYEIAVTAMALRFFMKDCEPTI